MTAPVGEVLRQWDPAPTLRGAIWWFALMLEPFWLFLLLEVNPTEVMGPVHSDDCVRIFILPLFV